MRFKCRDGFCPIGTPVARDTVADANTLTLVVEIDGVEVRRAATAGQIRPVERLIAEVSEIVGIGRLQNSMIAEGTVWDAHASPMPALFTRWSNTRKVFDTISNFAANAGIVTGGRPVRPHDVDLRWVGTMLYKNGVIEETGLAAGVLNQPAIGVAWLANKIAPHDEQLNAGDVVLAGSFTRPTPAVMGDNIHVDYGPLDSVAFRFA